MEKVRLTICGTEYVLTTDENEAYMQDLAGRVERAMQGMLVNPRISITMAAVMAALNSEDTAQKALQSADNLRAQMKEYLDDNSRARSESSSAKMETERLRQEISLLRQKLALAERRSEGGGDFFSLGD